MRMKWWQWGSSAVSKCSAIFPEARYTRLSVALILIAISRSHSVVDSLFSLSFSTLRHPLAGLIVTDCKDAFLRVSSRTPKRQQELHAHDCKLFFSLFFCTRHWDGNSTYPWHVASLPTLLSRASTMLWNSTSWSSNPWLAQTRLVFSTRCSPFDAQFVFQVPLS